MTHHDARYVVPFEDLRMTDVDSVGGKNASLGEMISQLSHMHDVGRAHMLLHLCERNR